MAINKVVLGERTLIDLSLDTATEADVAKGKYFHRADGEIVEGTLEGSGGGGGGGGGLVESDVNFYDYDGTLLYAYPRVAVLEMTELPAPPTHEGLTFQGWNWTLAEIQAHEGQVNVGAVYVTDDGKTRFYIAIDYMVPRTVTLYFCISTLGDTVVINWGDGTGDETYAIEAYNNGAFYAKNPRTFVHTYNDAGEYLITVDSTEKIDLGYNNSVFYNSTTADRQILRRLELGENIRYITTNSMAGFKSLKHITIPEGVTYQNATGSSRTYFSGCYSLESIVLPRTFNLDENLLDECYGLKMFSSLQTKFMRKNMLKNCYSLRTANAPRNEVPECCFSGCSFEQFDLSGVTTIGKSAFSGCRMLREAKLPIATSIGELAFSANYALKSVELGSKLRSIGKKAFNQCYSLREINIPNGVTSMEDQVFYQCRCLQSIEIPNSVTSVGFGIFYACNDLVEVMLPSGLTSIGASFFYQCASLPEVKVPSSVASIGGDAFGSCTRLKCLDFSDHTSVPTLSATSAFLNTPSDMKIRVPAALYDEWISATNWSNSNVKSKIVAV